MYEKSDQFVVASGRKLLVIQWDGVSGVAKILRTYAEVDQVPGITRFNDGKIDPRGNIFTGTALDERYGEPFTTRNGTLYRFRFGQGIPIRRNIMLSNGMTWSEKTNKYYYADSGDYFLMEYDYDPCTGSVSNGHCVFAIKDKSWFIDGMTIDACGFIYLTAFHAGKVVVFDPITRKIVRELVIPDATQITSVAFGGPNLDELFVTTAALEFEGRSGKSGKIFKVTGFGAKGLRMYSAKI